MISQLSVYIYSSFLLIHYTSFYTSFCPTAFLCRGTWFPVWNLRWRQWRKGPKKGRPTQPEATLLSWGTRMLRHLRWIKTRRTKLQEDEKFPSSWSLSISSVSASSIRVLRRSGRDCGGTPRVILNSLWWWKKSRLEVIGGAWILHSSSQIHVSHHTVWIGSILMISQERAARI